MIKHLRSLQCLALMAVFAIMAVGCASPDLSVEPGALKVTNLTPDQPVGNASVTTTVIKAYANGKEKDSGVSWAWEGVNVAPSADMAEVDGAASGEQTLGLSEAGLERLILQTIISSEVVDADGMQMVESKKVLQELHVKDGMLYVETADGEMQPLDVISLVRTKGNNGQFGFQSDVIFTHLED